MKKFTVVLLVFLFAIILRLWNLNEMGRVWDEPFYVGQGYAFVEFIKARDFSNKIWYSHPDPPPLAKILFGISQHLSPTTLDAKNEVDLPYNLTFPRLVSVFFAGLSVVIILLIGWEYFSPSIGISAGAIFATLPFFLGLSQVATIESTLMFFFTISMYSFLKFLDKPSLTRSIIAGIFAGFALLTKFTNALLFIIFAWIFLIWFLKSKKKIDKQLLIGTLCIPFVSFMTFVLVWPMPWFHLDYIIPYIYHLRITQNVLPVPEVFFGNLVLVPKVYYFVYFLITTPGVFLLLFILGLIAILKVAKLSFPHYKSDNLYCAMRNHMKTFFLLALPSKNARKIFFCYTLIIWFCIPFLQSFYAYKQHGVRYIIQIYAPLSLISAIGLDFAIKRFSSIKARIVILVGLAFYIILTLKSISPYYLDYFNEVVGGTKKVYKKKLFQMGWWGQGIKEGALYIEKKAPAGSIVAIALSPSHVMPTMPQFTIKNYKQNELYDYVIVNYYNVLREGFDDSEIKKYYNVVYEVNADGAKLATVYKHK